MNVYTHLCMCTYVFIAKLSYGKTIDVTTVPIKGISAITSVDFEYAALLNSSIKLLGAASKNPDGSIAVYVSPMVVPKSSPFATAKGPGNMVVINSSNNTQSTLAGPGEISFHSLYPCFDMSIYVM